MDIQHSERQTLTVPRESIEFAVGTKIGSYRISSLFREGSQATLFIVTDAAEKRFVMRVYFDGMEPPTELHRRLLHTTDMNVCRILAKGEHGGHIYDVIPLLREIPDIRTLSDEAQTALIKEETQAVKSFHRLGFVHLDIKIEHFMLTESENICLVDIGSAKRIGTAAPSFPSQFLPADAYTSEVRKESDYYSFGISLIEQYCPEWLMGKDRDAIRRLLQDRDGVIQLIEQLPTAIQRDVQALIADNPEARKSCSWFAEIPRQTSNPARPTISKAKYDLIILCLKKELLTIASCSAPQVYACNVKNAATTVRLNDPYSVLAFLNYLKTIPRNAQPCNYTNLTEETVLSSLTSGIETSVSELSPKDPIRTLRKYQRQNIFYIYDRQLIEEMDREGAVIANKHDEIAWATLRIIGIILGVIAAIAVAVAIIIALIYILVFLLCVAIVVGIICAALSS